MRIGEQKGIGPGRARALSIGIIAALAFTAVASINLDAQGIYYDELHQALSAFHYLGGHPTGFDIAFRGVPILNMNYTSAIKSNIYGLYLKYVNPRFTPYSWRLLGIVFVAIGLLAFYQIAGPMLPSTAGLVFGAMVLTDTSILLATRHDWGPVALSFCFRLLFLSLWLSIDLADPAGWASGAGWKHFFAGFIAGIAIFEKLSAVVLLAPMGILIFTAWRRTSTVRIAGIAGLFAGSLPLILVNIGLFGRVHGLVSLSDLSAENSTRHSLDVFAYGYEYLALGQGVGVRQFILGDFSNPLWAQAEAIVMLSALLTMGVAAFQLRRKNRLMVLAGSMVASYFLVGILLYLLPRETSVHHWVMGTPFQYAALVLALAALAVQKERLVLWIAVAVLLGLRIPNFIAVERSLVAGNTSSSFDPALTRLAEIAAGRSDDAAFISADWGTANQIYCVGNGRDDLVYEPFWSADPAGRLQEIAQSTKKNSLYVLETGIAPQFAEASASVLRFMTTSSAWQEVPVEKEFANLSPIRVRKFVRRS